MNSTSSRSHTVLTINIEQRITGDKKPSLNNINYSKTLRSKLLMVDLAGIKNCLRFFYYITALYTTTVYYCYTVYHYIIFCIRISFFFYNCNHNYFHRYTFVTHSLNICYQFGTPYTRFRTSSPYCQQRNSIVRSEKHQHEFIGTRKRDCGVGRTKRHAHPIP
jgi:hypothetical protein